jgi:hypothetical protein
LIVSHYESFDLEDRALIPLVRIYWPVDELKGGLCVDFLKSGIDSSNIFNQPFAKCGDTRVLGVL